MHAVDFYTSVCRCVMEANPENEANWSDLRRLLPCLRQSLGCYVCFKILQEPMGPNHSVCRHFVCSKCVGGKMKLKPSCSWCKDHYLFVPNPLLKILVTCFKKLCVYIYNSPLGHTISCAYVNGETNQLLNILQEGIDIQDNYVSTNSVEGLHLPVMTDARASTSTEPFASTSHSDESTFVHNTRGMDTHHSHKTEELHIDVEDTVSASVFRSAKEARKRKVIKKSVTFMKKAVQNKSRQKVKVSCKKSSQKSKRHGKFKGKFRGKSRANREAPRDLEKIDVSEPAVKKVKIELQPPELKPLSSCKCGKSGNFNQLTCIGQRCPCYSMKLPCLGTCQCRGCRNPKKGPDYQGSNPCNSAVLRSGTRTTVESLCVNM